MTSRLSGLSGLDGQSLSRSWVYRNRGHGGAPPVYIRAYPALTSPSTPLPILTPNSNQVFTIIPLINYIIVLLSSAVIRLHFGILYPAPRAQHL